MKFGPYITCSFSLDSARVRSLSLTDRVRPLIFSLFLFSFTIFFASNLSAQCVVSCKSSLNVSLGLNGTSIMTPGILLVDPDCNPADFTVNITDSQGNSYGNTLTCANIGQSLTALVTQTATGNACATSIYVYDYLPPFLTCQDTTIICVASSHPDSIGYPLVSDNCASLNYTDLSYSDQINELPCFYFHNGDSITTHIERTWSVSDDYGNFKSCVQNIYLKRATIADVVFPKDRNGYDAPVLDCNEDPYDLTLVGEPKINNRRIKANGYCEFVISYSDQIVPICSPAGFTIIRTWTVIDWCSDDFTLHAQIIKVKDLTAPVIACPADFTVGTNVDDCTGSVYLPNASATDDCSSFTISPSWAFGSGNGPFGNVPLGVHEVTYTAEDACGNVSTCTINVSVIDNVPPVPVCDATTIVNLTSNGQGLVNATTFDDGSNDNCQMGEVLVSRDGNNFTSTIVFTCDDLALSPLSLTLRVFDAAGNFNDCSVYAIIEDKLSPVVVCPSTAYLDCSEDYLDVGITGQPLVQDNCEIDTLYFSDNVQLNSCNVGHVIRTWTAEDKFGNKTSCLQWIYLEDNTPLQVVSFPNNYATTVCGAALDPTITGVPILSGDDCELLYVGFTDDTLNIAAPACFVINRKWEIIDWCNHDPNANPVTGYWTHTQVITVDDVEDPIIQSPADLTIGSFSANCGGVFVNLSNATATDCSPNVSIINNSPYADQNGANASGVYPIGTHNIVFTAQDGCGNTSNAAMVLTVVDSLPPQAICFDGLSLTIGADGTVSLPAAMLDAGSTDNCTAQENLLISVSPSTFTCNDLGDNSVTLSVTDEMGNTGVCVAIVNIQNNMGFCPFIQLGGGVEKENGTPVSEVMVKVNGAVSDSVVIGADGVYNFQNLPEGMNYSIKPTKKTAAGNGVSTIDLILISRHLLGLAPLNSPYKKIAADVDNNKRINTFDIIQMQKVILFIDTIFPKAPSWRFVDASYTFPNNDPFSSPFPETLELNNQGQDLLNGDFVAIKIGDVNGNARPADSQQEAADRSEEEPLEFFTEEKSFSAGEELSVPVRIKQTEGLLGFQYTLAFDPDVLEWNGLDLSGENSDLQLKEENFGLKFLDRGLVTISWFKLDPLQAASGELLFKLNFTARESARLSEVLSFNSQLTTAEAYVEGAAERGVQLSFVQPEKELVSDDLVLSNFPNPFVEETSIFFEVLAEQKGIFKLFDGQGKLVFYEQKTFFPGPQQLIINAALLGMSRGVYFYFLELEDGKQQQGKMIKTDG